MEASLREELILKLKNGKTSADIFPFAKENGYSGNYKTFKNYICNLRKDIAVEPIVKKENVIQPMIIDEDKYIDLGSDILRFLRKEKSCKLLDMCDKFDCPPNVIMTSMYEIKKSGYEIFMDDSVVFLGSGAHAISQPTKTVDPIGTTEVTFAVASDLHFGSKHCQITALNEFCEVCRSKGIKHILTPGDVFAGSNVYPGQLQDLYAISADEQLNSAIANLPEGFEWYMLGGNHDYSFLSKGGGYNIINVLANNRPDVHYIGFDAADVPILSGVDATLLHPSGGSAYSLSYKLQKNVEQIAYSELTNMAYGYKDKPSVRFVLSGHLHIQVQAMIGSIFGAQCGCFEGQTNYLKRKGLFPNIGGYIIQACLDSTGRLRNHESKFYIFDETDDDYKNYRHSPSFDNLEESLLEPLFERIA